MLEAHIKKAPEDSTTENDSHLKKVNLLSYWINTYCRFIKKEKTFDASKNKVYKRGEIIQVDLGFRIGHEEGGLHYAVVLNKKDSPYSDILTIFLFHLKKNIPHLINSLLIWETKYMISSIKSICKNSIIQFKM